jgi:hypothetical protein
MSDFHEWSTVKTRKDHKCDGCLVTIPKSDKVDICQGKNENGFYKIYICNDCSDHISKYNDLYRDGWVTGEIGHDRKEYARASAMNTA